MTRTHTTAPLLSDLDVITGLMSNDVPSHRNLEAFHVIKSDIVDRLCAFKAQLRGYLMATEKIKKPAAAMQPSLILHESEKMTLTISGEKDGSCASPAPH